MKLAFALSSLSPVGVAMTTAVLLANPPDRPASEQAGPDAKPSVLDRTVANFSAENVSMFDVCALLHQKDVVVSFEAVKLDKQDKTGPGPRFDSSPQKRFSVDVANGTVRDVLNAAVMADPDYAYSCTEATGMVHIFPKTGALLDWTITEADISNIAIGQLTGDPEHDALGLQKRGLVPGVLKGNLGWAAVRVTVNLKNIHIRDALALVLGVATDYRPFYRAGMVQGRPYFAVFAKDPGPKPTSCPVSASSGPSVTNPRAAGP